MPGRQYTIALHKNTAVRMFTNEQGLPSLQDRESHEGAIALALTGG